jgi:hypothetical protein
MSKFKDLFKDEAAKVSASLSQVRDQIAAKRKERDELAAAPLARSDIEMRIDSWLDQEAEKSFFATHAREFATPGPREGSPLRLNLVYKHIDMGPMLVSLFREKIRQAILDHLPEDDGVPMADRPSRLARIENDIFRLEVHEEQLIEEAAEAGIELERRVDASPEAILSVEWPEDAAA